MRVLRDIDLMLQVLFIKLDMFLFRSPKSDWRRLKGANKSAGAPKAL